MSRFRNKLVKRVMAVILSGAMVMSCMPSSNMTAFASEALTDTGGGYESETEEISTEKDADVETAVHEDAADQETANASAKEEAVSKDEGNASSDKKDDSEDTKDTAKETVAADNAGSDDYADVVEEDKASETKPSLSAEEEPGERDEKDEDVREYAEPDPSKSTITKYADTFIGTGFGNSNNLSNAKWTTTASGCMNITETGGDYKLTTNEGMAMYYAKIENGVPFTFKARAKVTATTSSYNQSVFGLMARDDMYINEKVTLTADYIAACATSSEGDSGVYLKQGGTWKRNGQLGDGKMTVEAADAVGKVYDFGISYDGTKYTIKVNDQTWETSDLNLKSVDKNIYVGMFATRKMGADFYRIYLATDDKDPIMDQRADVSGTITGVDTLAAGTEITFVDADKEETKGTITKEENGYSYSAKLYEGTYTVKVGDYTVSKVENDNDSTGDTVTVANKAAKTLDAVTNNIKLTAESKPDVSGTVTVPENAIGLDDLVITFTKDGKDVEVTPDSNGSYSTKLAAGIYTVKVTAGYIEDYTVDKTSLTVGSDNITDADITLTEKTKQNVTVTLESYDNAITELPSAIIFTRTGENDPAEGYTYECESLDNIKLRAGTYSVRLKEILNDRHMLDSASKTLTVGSSAVNHTLNFEERMVWDFTGADSDLTNTVQQNTDQDQQYHGLTINTAGNKTITGTYIKDGETDPASFTSYGKFNVATSGQLRVQVNATTEIWIPVEGTGTVTIEGSNPGYTMDGELTKEASKTWSYTDKAKGSTMKLQVVGTKWDSTNSAVVGDSLWLTKIAITREEVPGDEEEITGTIAFPDGENIPSGLEITFTPTSGTAVKAQITGNSYTATLNKDVTYTISVTGADGYTFSPEQMSTKTEDKTITFTKRAAVTRTEWDFMKGSPLYATDKVVGFEGVSGTLEGLQIDATKGKFNTKDRVQDGWAQVNSPVTIKVPVNGASTITTSWNGQEEYTIDNSPKMTGTGSYISKGNNGWATITVTKGGYLGKISVKELDKVNVSGNVNLPSDAPSGMKVIFTEKTDRASKFVVEADIVDGKYETALYCTGEKYAISLSNESYNVTVPEGAVIDAVKNVEDISQDITAESVELSKVDGNVVFPEGKTIPADLKLTFTEKVTSGTPHVVEDVSVSDAKFETNLKQDTVYTVTARGTRINDFEVKAPGELNTADQKKEIEFVEKTQHEVRLAVTSFDENAIDKSKIQIVFTNINEAGYTYEFTGTDTVTLRDGTYSAKAKAGYPYVPGTLAQFTVDGAAVDYAIDFTERLEWSFHTGSDLMAAENQISVQGSNAGEDGIVDLEGLKINVKNGKFSTQGRSADAQVNQGTIIKIPLRTRSEVTIEGYDAASNYTVDGTQNTKVVDTFVCEGTDGYATFVMLPKSDISGLYGEYLKSITVKPIKEVVIPDNRKIDVWDFAGKQETDTEKYNNNITPAMWVESGLLQTSSDGDSGAGRFKGDKNTAFTHPFGDLLMTYHGQDRLYSTDSTITGNDISAGNSYVTKYDDGYETIGAWYCNGVGSATTRNVTIDNVASGDIIVVYAGKHNGDVTYWFEGVGVENTQKEAGPILNGGAPQYQKLTFIAENTGTYKVYPVGSGSSPKNLYHRIMRIPGVKVKGTIDFANHPLENYTVRFINQETKQEFPVTVKEDNSFELSLAPGYTYLAVLSGAPGYGFANEGKTITIPKDSAAIDNVRLTVETKDMYQFTGKIKGLEAGTKTDRLVMTMIPPKDSNSDEVTLNINKETLDFNAYMESNLEYTIRLEGADDYVVKTPLSVKSTTDLPQDIVLERKPRYTAKGAFIGLEDAKVTELSFTLLNDAGAEDNNYVYSADIVNGGYGYSVLLRDGAYIAKATVDKAGYTTQSHVVVDGADVYKDLMFVSAEATTPLERAANLYVGYPGKKNNYSTVNAAVKAAKRMEPKSEGERITIHIAPGTYTEQLLIDVPYITFMNDEPSKEVKLTWYYGIGYKYYSAKNGYYDEASAFDKYEKNEVKDWGTTVRLNAPGFRAENIIFENSFNQRIVDAELEDGVESAGSKPVRKTGVDVESSDYKERACVMYINDSADKAEFYKCQFISNQDTLGTGKKGTHSYYKDCLFEGTTDYICGDGDCVFDNCELRWAGQSDKPTGGYITAAQGSSNNGYLFWNCKITANKKRQVSKGYLGRPWGAAAKVIFVNTELESANLIDAEGWTSMSSNKPENANFKEYGTTCNGASVDTSKRTSGTVVTENPVPDMTVFFEGWTPLYYNYDETKVVREPVSSEKRSDVEAGTEITLSCDTADAKIYYTLDGEDPTGKDSELYTAGTKISLGSEEKTVIVKAIAKVGDISSSIAVFEYHVKNPANLITAPTASVEPGVVAAGTPVLLNCATDGATIYFTIDGSEPKADNNLLYRNQPILIYDTMIIKAIAVKDTNISEPVEFKYEVKATLTAEPGDGTVFTSAGGAVTLSAASGATIYYTISSKEADLTDPADGNNTKRVEYKAPIQITEETYIWAVAVKDGLAGDPIKCHYRVLAEGEVVPPLATPGTLNGTSEVKSGTVVTLTVMDDTIEHIYYTTDGSDPTVEGDARKTYDPVVGISVTETVTIKAAAWKDNKYSEVVTYTYTIKEDDNPDNPSTDPDDPGEDKTNIQITGLDKVYYFTGAKIIPDIKVWDCDIKGDGRRLLIEGTDYTVKYANNTKVTTADKPATLTVAGKGNYAGKDITESFQIQMKESKDITLINLKGAKIAKIGSMTYTGDARHPEFTLTPKGGTPVIYEYDSAKNEYVRQDKKPMDINVAVSGNINKGTATILATGEKDVKGKATSVKATFKITPIDLKANAGKVVVTASDAEYGVKGAIPSVTVTYDGKTLKNGRDYTLKFAKNKKAGASGTVTVTGKGNYAKKCDPVGFGIKQLDISKLEVKAVTAYSDIDAGKIKATVFDKAKNALKASQYEVIVYKALTGTDAYGKGDKLAEKTKIYVAVKAKDANLTGETPRAEFTVGIDISKAKIALKKVNGKAATKEYTGAEIELTPEEMEATLKVKGEASPRTLEMSKDGGITGDYVIAFYTNNVDKGTATAVIKGINNYSGTKTIKFKIVPQKMVKGTTTNLINNFVTKFAN